MSDALKQAAHRVLESFEIAGPDADGLLWLVLHGTGTTGKAMFYLGSPDRVAGQVAVLLEQDRRAALAAPQAGPVGSGSSMLAFDAACYGGDWPAPQPAAPQAGPVGEAVRDAAVTLVEAYKKKYRRARGDLREDAPLLQEFTAFNAALYAAPQPAAPQPREADPLTQAIQRLNATPYNLTKDECIAALRILRDEQAAAPEPDAYAAGFLAGQQYGRGAAHVAVREPLTFDQIKVGAIRCGLSGDELTDIFEEGVRFAERAHGIGIKQPGSEA